MVHFTAKTVKSHKSYFATPHGVFSWKSDGSLLFPIVILQANCLFDTAYDECWFMEVGSTKLRRLGGGWVMFLAWRRRFILKIPYGADFSKGFVATLNCFASLSTGEQIPMTPIEPLTGYIENHYQDYISIIKVKDFKSLTCFRFDYHTAANDYLETLGVPRLLESLPE